MILILEQQTVQNLGLPAGLMGLVGDKLKYLSI